MRFQKHFRALLAGLPLAWGCASSPPPTPTCEPTPEPIDPAIFARAQEVRSVYFEREVERLRADLVQAEESIVALESGLRAHHSRADAVSAVAEARIGLERVQQRVPWRSERVEEATAKLREAERQLEVGHVGTAIFFASRAQRITRTLRLEADQVSEWDERKVIRASRVNLRSAPSLEATIVQVLSQNTPVHPERLLEPWLLVRTPEGSVGWVHDTLLTASP